MVDVVMEWFSGVQNPCRLRINSVRGNFATQRLEIKERVIGTSSQIQTTNSTNDKPTWKLNGFGGTSAKYRNSYVNIDYLAMFLL